MYYYYAMDRSFYHRQDCPQANRQVCIYLYVDVSFFSERELTFTFAICYRPSVCRLSVVCLSVTFVRPTQAIEIFGNIFTALGTLVIR